MSTSVNIFWFRRDLRLDDNAGLYHSLKAGLPVVPIFIFDKNILNELEEKADRRVEFIHAVITELQEKLQKLKSSVEVFYATPVEAFNKLIEKYSINKVFTNHDYEPYAIDRDGEIKSLLEKSGISFATFKDQVIFDKKEIVKDNGEPYSIFTPYSRKWLDKLNDFYFKPYPVKKYLKNLYKQQSHTTPTLKSMGFREVGKPFPAKELEEELVSKYGKDRDYPGMKGTSRLGVHFRFGTVSIRDIAKRSQQLSNVYLKELIWRDFYQMILWNFPHVGKGKAFKLEYDHIKWRNNESEFEKWCQGQTGYPIVDAGIRELNETGFMHNRIRMVVASFLTKHLLIDWRWGEAYFAQKLLDYDLAANNGGWQWASGSGCDAAPYFRIFNPYLQTKKFDPDLTYISKWVPEFQEFNYPKPIVDHEIARKRCLEVYSKALKKAQ